jgi:hypothetical protein
MSDEERVAKFLDEATDAHFDAIKETLRYWLHEPANSRSFQRLLDDLNELIYPEDEEEEEEMSTAAHLFALFASGEDEDIDRLGPRARAEVERIRLSFGSRLRDFLSRVTDLPEDWTAYVVEPFIRVNRDGTQSHYLAVQILKNDGSVLRIESPTASIVRLLRGLVTRLSTMPEVHLQELRLSQIDSFRSAIEGLHGKLQEIQQAGKTQ